MDLRKLKLYNGVKMPLVGLGTYLMTEGHAVYEAVKMGYRLIDTAIIYKNSQMVKTDLDRAFSEKIITREDLFITSKYWPVTDRRSAKDVVADCKKEIKDLGLDYLDLWLIHWPMKHHYEIWKGFEELYDLGLVRAIGVSNYNVRFFEDLMANKLKYTPMVNQIELHPGLPCKETRAFCKKHKIFVQAWRSLFLHKEKVLSSEMLLKIGKKYNKTPAQVLLNWAYIQDIGVIPKSKSKDHLLENIQSFDFKLDEADFKTICQMEDLRIGFELDHFWNS